MEAKKEKKQATVHLDIDVYAKIEEQAKILRRSKSFVVNELLRQKYNIK
tara:strand:- start:488 stop:634 length:147 start_codon:yes stop_codon:yes gene_type:complete